jgi:hypothetical protein
MPGHLKSTLLMAKIELEVGSKGEEDGDEFKVEEEDNEE